MNNESRTEIGTIEIRDQVIAEIAMKAIQEVPGAKLISGDVVSKVIEFFGKKSYSGIKVSIDKSNEVTLGLRVSIAYDQNIPSVAKELQTKVKSAIEKSTDIMLKNINVEVQGIGRGGE